MALPTVEELEDRLEFKLEPELATAALGNLEDLIIEARALGRMWTDAEFPPVVAKCIRQAMLRWLRRPDGYIQSRAGDETLAWAEGDWEAAGVPRFTKGEMEQIQEAAMGVKMGPMVVVPTTPHGPTTWRDDRLQPSFGIPTTLPLEVTRP